MPEVAQVHIYTDVEYIADWTNGVDRIATEAAYFEQLMKLVYGHFESMDVDVDFRITDHETNGIFPRVSVKMDRVFDPGQVENIEAILERHEKDTSWIVLK